MHQLIFFFSSRRRHTRSLCDWSSDVCSSDLRAVLNAALDFLGIDARQLRLQHHIVVGLIDVDRRSPAPNTQLGALVEEARERAIEQPIESVLRGKQIAKWFPAYNRHGLLPPCKSSHG